MNISSIIRGTLTLTFLLITPTALLFGLTAIDQDIKMLYTLVGLLSATMFCRDVWDYNPR